MIPGDASTSKGESRKQRQTIDQAVKYVKEVEKVFHDEKQKYKQFIEIMKDFKEHRLDIKIVTARVKELFKGHNNLIFGFNNFLPKEYEIYINKNRAEFNKATDFVNKIKVQFQNDDRMYKSFLKIIHAYYTQHTAFTEVYDQVSELFEGHPDLLEEFVYFLPDQ